ncbi:MAG: hypothetical protein ACM3O3_12620 [Syntrophothermus sp.]
MAGRKKGVEEKTKNVCIRMSKETNLRLNKIKLFNMQNDIEENSSSKIVTKLINNEYDKTFGTKK